MAKKHRRGVVGRPAVVEDKHLEFLDRTDRVIAKNLFMGTQAICKKFGLPPEHARTILIYWIETLGKERR